ncbi:MAG: oligosaccharide flippase family protein [Planctomycetes bacterium]|nr:oligosaccharide flippase family protein [Planctomycetota bacterium]
MDGIGLTAVETYMVTSQVGEQSRNAVEATSGKRVSLNALSNFVVMGVDMAIQICLLSFILRMLTKEVYGIWAITGGLFAYSALLQLGINSAVNYFIPPMLAKGDQEGLNRVVSTALVFYLMVACLIVGATVVLFFYFPIWFHISPEHVGISQALVIMVGGYFAIATPLTVFRGVMSGMQRYVPLNTLAFCCRLARAGLIVGLMLAGFGVLGLAVAHVGARLAEVIGAPLLAKRYLPELKIRWSSASMAQFWEMLGYSIYTLMWSLFDTVRDRAGFIVIGVLLTTASATLYAIPVMIMQAVYSVVRSFASVTKPAATSLMAEGDSNKIRELVLKGNRFVGALVLSLVAVLVIMGKPIIHVWVGSDFEPMAGILAILLGCELLTLIQMIPAYVLIGLGKQKPLAFFTLAMVVVSISSMIVLVAHFDAGLWGIALGGSFPALVYGAVFLPVYTCRVIGAAIPTYLWVSLGRPVLAVLPFATVLGAAQYWYKPTTKIELLAVGVASGVILAICGVLILMDRAERAIAWKMAKGSRRSPVGEMVER